MTRRTVDEGTRLINHVLAAGREWIALRRNVNEQSSHARQQVTEELHEALQNYETFVNARVPGG